MKRIILIAVILLSTLVLNAQVEDSKNVSLFEEKDFKQEIKLSFGGSLHKFDYQYYLFGGSYSFTYFYRPAKWFWLGLNLVGAVGDIEKYYWREYYTDNTYKDFVKAEQNYGFALAPELKFSYLNRKKIVLYSAISVGYCWDTVDYVKNHIYFQITGIGFSYYFWRKNSIFLGGEHGGGFKGLFNMHGGYRF